MVKIKLGDIWVSESHPHESFEIYAGIVDTCHDSFPFDVKHFDELPEGAKILFWRRADEVSYDKFLEDKFGRTYRTFPYAYCGECKKGSLVSKIKKFNMKLSDNKCEVEYFHLD